MSMKEDHHQFKDGILKTHNQCRKKHNTAQVAWSDQLANKAQKWAEHIAKKGKFEHSPPKDRKGEGENIACAGGKDLTGEDACMMWYNEIKDYTFTPKPTYNPKCGHFTQMVWKETKEIGAGRAQAKNGMIYVVCRYGPAGNNLSLFAENINPPISTDNDINMNKFPGKEQITPLMEGEVCSAPEMQQDKTEDKDKSAPEYEESEQPRRVIEAFELTFEKKFVVGNRMEENPRLVLRTVQVDKIEQIVRRAAYKSRDNYLKVGNSYVITHNCYVDK